MASNGKYEGLKGLTVLSQEQALALTYCTLRLAMKGATVIRLEALQGDPNRYVGERLGQEKGMNSYFLPVNAGKKSITLNLRDERGKQLLWRLISELKVDIFCTNQLPKNYEPLGISYEAIRAVKPDIIWVGLSGFGPERSEPAYDPVIQALTGIMDETGEPDRDPMLVGVPIVDLEAGNQAYASIMEALYKRERTGEGSRIDISMVQCALSLLVTKIPNIAFGEPVGRNGNRHRFFAPVDTYPTKDGFIMLATGNDQQWKAITRLPGFESLDRPEYEKNEGRINRVEQLTQEIRAITSKMTTDELLKLLKEAGVASAKVNSVRDVMNDSFFNRLTWSTEDPVTGIKVTLAPPPVEVPERPDRRLPFSPRLGEHNRYVFCELLRVPEDEFELLQRDGVIGVSSI